MIKIVKGAAPPVKRRASLYPLDELAVGDGMDVPDDMGEYDTGRSCREVSVRNAVNFYRKSNPEAAFAIGDHPTKRGVIRIVRTA
jgi:hypothetical protein